MSETPWQDLRVGDTDRESALRSLGDHMAAGRLTVDEYGDRASHVAAAKTRGELAAVFSDLPEPRPRFGPVAPPPAHPPPTFPPHIPPHAYPSHPYGPHGYPPHGYSPHGNPPAYPPRRGLSQQLAAYAPVAIGVVVFAVLVFGFRIFSPVLVIPLVFLFLAGRRRRWH